MTSLKNSQQNAPSAWSGSATGLCLVAICAVRAVQTNWAGCVASAAWRSILHRCAGFLSNVNSPHRRLNSSAPSATSFEGEGRAVRPVEDQRVDSDLVALQQAAPPSPQPDIAPMTGLQLHGENWDWESGGGGWLSRPSWSCLAMRACLAAAHKCIWRHCPTCPIIRSTFFFRAGPGSYAARETQRLLMRVCLWEPRFM